ncbi:hypothetical protein [Rossellomorea sp. YZS02]|uniref:hypothetical protein n=1 Tax=Rossellomorea sp. YZS02 TaxID=3097358 RepID=UPI002A16DB8D|nr:hypothetical protein [Rossellomorea sp. YZS02]MDX8343164.1 hypothetical protein [Rossellomorea sp. YZS02]
MFTLIFLFINVGDRHSNNPEQVMKDFYDFEKMGDFGSSWDLFHSEMKKKFSKSTYIQTKNHVFMGHMGVDTFKVEIEEITDQKEFKFSKDGPTFKNVKKGKVAMKYDSQFGKLTIYQTCYTVQEEGEWKILWDYQF